MIAGLPGEFGWNPWKDGSLTTWNTEFAEATACTVGLKRAERQSATAMAGS